MVRWDDASQSGPRVCEQRTRDDDGNNESVGYQFGDGRQVIDEKRGGRKNEPKYIANCQEAERSCFAQCWRDVQELHEAESGFMQE